MKIKFKLSKERIQIVIVFLVTMFICLIPLFSINCIQGHDLEYHLLRIESLKEGILNGLPFLKINMLFFGGRGYASSLFYPDFLLYIPALLRCAGVSINLSYHIFVALCFMAAFAAMYFCVNEMWGNKYLALMSAVIYSLAQYHLDDVYTRAAVGEYCAFIFIPFLLYGLYQMVCGKMEKPQIMVIGFCGLILCHTITTILMIGVYLVAFIISFKKLLAEKKPIITLILSAIFVIAITAFYWAPVIEQLSISSFAGAAIFDLNYEKLMLVDIFTNTNPGLGIVLFIPMLFRIFIKTKSDKIRFADLCMVAGILAALVSTGLLPWARLQNYLGFMQFPWRTFMVATPMLSVAGAIYITAYFGSDFDNTKSQITILLLVAIMGACAINTYGRLDQGYYSYSNDYYDYEKFTGAVIGGEWLPATVEDRSKLTDNCNIAYSENGNIEVSRYKNTLSFVSDGSEFVDVPFIYYKGYRATVGETEAVVTGNGDNGMCRVMLNGSNGETVIVKYMQTIVQTCSEIVSVISLIIFIFSMCVRRKKD